MSAVVDLPRVRRALTARDAIAAQGLRPPRAGAALDIQLTIGNVSEVKALSFTVNQFTHHRLAQFGSWF